MIMSASKPTNLIQLLLLLTAVMTFGCKPAASPQPGKPVVIASFYPLYDFARQLAGTNVNVVCLVPPGGDPHGMEATPDTAKQIANARAVFLLGIGMDTWLDKLAQSTPQVRRVVLSEGIATRPFGKTTLTEFAAADAEHHDHAPEDIDPHVWLDPVRAQQIVTRLAAELKQISPESAASITANEAQLLGELRQLDADFKTATADLNRRDIVTFHGAFGYLFDRYQLNTAGVVELFPGDQPSAAYLRALVDLMRQLDIKTIFAEPQLPDTSAQIIAREIGGKIERLDPCETILPEAPEATYVERQRKNFETLRRVLSATP
jgi:zinc transport system substrate-binding protein